MRQKRKRIINAAMRESLPEPGHAPLGAGKGKVAGPTLYQAIKSELSKASKVLKGGKRGQFRRVHEVAKAFVDEAAGGSFPHANAIIEREEGKIGVGSMDPNVGVKVIIERA